MAAPKLGLAKWASTQTAAYRHHRVLNYQQDVDSLGSRTTYWNRGESLRSRQLRSPKELEMSTARKPIAVEAVRHPAQPVKGPVSVAAFHEQFSKRYPKMLAKLAK